MIGGETTLYYRPNDLEVLQLYITYNDSTMSKSHTMSVSLLVTPVSSLSSLP